MDVAYSGTQNNQEVILHRRNMTIGIACGCKAEKVRRFQQAETFHIED